jgi:hypothetical protein
MTEEQDKKIAEISRHRQELWDRKASEDTMTAGKLTVQAEERGIAYNAPTRRTTPVTQTEIVERLAGGDMTEGSCASLAISYVGQQDGYDVLDFRDGASREYMSRNTQSIILSAARETGGAALVETSEETAVENSVKLLRRAEEGHEYLFVTGQHAAIVRRRGEDIDYLELQSGQSNGWKPMTRDTFGAHGGEDGLRYMLKWRFGASEESLPEAIMADVESVKGSLTMKQAYGFINTAADQQHKGSTGHEK